MVAMPTMVTATPASSHSPCPWNKSVPTSRAGSSVPKAEQVPKAMLCPKATPR